MSGFRPAGESSDEDDYDGFSFGDDFDERRRENRYQHQNTVIAAQQQRNERDAEIIEIICSGTLDDLVAAHRNAPSFSVNEPLRNDWTPLMHAALAGKLDMVHWLLAHEADINYRVNGTTALMAAVLAPDREDEDVLSMVQTLLNNGAVLNTGDRSGRTAFMSMVENGYEQVVQHVLVSAGLEACDNDGNTALYYAIGAKRYDLVGLLLKNGAQTDILNNEGISPKQWAIDTGFDRMDEYFPEENKYEVPCRFMSMGRPKELAPTVFPDDEVPPFFYDLRRMLVQMKSEALEPLFVDANMSLMEFLAVDDERLNAIGVSFPFQRARIRYYLTKFHRKEFSPHTIRPFTNNHDMGDLFSTISGDLKQLLIADASVTFVSRNGFSADRASDIADMVTVLQEITSKLTRIRAIVAKANAASGKPVDYVPPRIARGHKTKPILMRLYKAALCAVCFVSGGFVARKCLL